MLLIFSTWKSDNFDKVTECAVTLKQIEGRLNESISKWKKIQKENSPHLRFSLGSKREIKIRNLSLTKPDGSPILSNFTRSIPKGKVTLLQGASGIGKTSVLRSHLLDFHLMQLVKSKV